MKRPNPGAGMFFYGPIFSMILWIVLMTGCTTAQKYFWFGDPNTPQQELPPIKPHSPMGLY